MTGPWYSQTEPYQILFGGTPVATTLVQSGVLRCFAPGKSFPIKKSWLLFLLFNQPFIQKSGFFLPKSKPQRTAAVNEPIMVTPHLVSKALTCGWIDCPFLMD